MVSASLELIFIIHFPKSTISNEIKLIFNSVLCESNVKKIRQMCVFCLHVQVYLRPQLSS